MSNLIGLSITSYLQNFGIEDLLDILLLVLVLCISLSFHEYAHARTAYYLGDDTAYLAGRMTLNPISHIDPIGAICFIFLRFGWAKPVPINPVRFTKSKSMKTGIVLTSIAGPISNIILTIVSTFIYFIIMTIIFVFKISIENNVIIALVQQFFTMMIELNLVLAVFNMFPIPPLDGSKIIGALLPNHIYYKVLRYERIIGMAFLALILLRGGWIGSFIHTIVRPLKYIIISPIGKVFELLWHGLNII